MKGKKTDLGQESCSIARSLQVIGDRWSLLIVRDAFLGHQRFGEFHKSIGMAKNILASRLKKLVQDGIFTVETDDAPAIRRYVLTERGQKLATVLVALWQWGEEHCFAADEPRARLVENESKRPLAKLTLVTAAGRKLRPGKARLALL